MGSNSYVVKAEYEGSMRRMTLEKKQQQGGGAAAELAFSFAQLEGRVRDLFQLPTAAPIGLTYVDRDGDAVTMADDMDLQDAFVMQSLNPLRLSVTKGDGGLAQPKAAQESSAAPDSKPAAASTAPAVAAAAAQAVPEQSEEPAKVAQKNGGKAEEKNASAGGDEKEEKMDVDVGVDGKENVEEESDSDKFKDIHYGIRCDSCNMFPIVGTRFKSCSKPNYDLCRACFKSTGAEPNDYVTIDRQFYRLVEPTFFARRMRNPRNLGCRPVGVSGKRPARQPLTGVGTSAPPDAKKDAEKNAEKDSSPAVHVGVQCDECGATPIRGPRFKSSVKFNYDVCLACFEKAGSNAQDYARYEQPLAVCPALLPGLAMGRMFPFAAFPRCGRRMWVHVADGGENPAPEVAETKAAETKAGEAGKTVTPSPPPPSGPAADSGEKSEATPSAGAQDGVVKAATAEATAATESPAVEEGENALDALVGKLGGMGFTDDSLNRELLQRNNLDLRKTLDELFAAEEWDPILGDLQEMGFYDEQMNRRLLIKNGGSMKRVVRELVQLDKEKKQA